jgi:DNA-3-methyladenine glycosylase II
MSPEEYRRAERRLARRDPVLRALIRAHGPCGLARSQREDPFVAMLEAIVWQQLSTRAAATIYSRVLAVLPNGGRPTPETIAAADPAALRAAGLSRAKVIYIQDLALKVRDRVVHLDRLHALDDDAVVEELTRVKGIGRWTAEMFLMFRLHRPDVLPVADVGIVNAIQRAYRLRRSPTPARMSRIAEAWRPYRSVACWYLWQSLDAAPIQPNFSKAATSKRSANRVIPSRLERTR